MSVFLALAACAASPASHASPSPTETGVKLLLDAPGVYAVSLAALSAAAGDNVLPPEHLWLERHDGAALVPVPHRVETPRDGSGPRLVFVADTVWFEPDDPREARPFEAVLARWRSAAPAGAADRADALPPGGGFPAVDPRELEQAVARRRLRFERDELRIPATLWHGDSLDTLWYWSRLTQQSSSRLEVDLGHLADRASTDLDLEITVRLLGWSRTRRPDGFDLHRVNLTLDDQLVGELAFDTDEPVTWRLEQLSAPRSGQGNHRLRVEVPERFVLTGADAADETRHRDPFLDIVYVDWVEVRYRVGGSLVHGTAPLEVETSEVSRWLPDPGSTGAPRLFSAAGWVAERHPAGGWVLPPTVGGRLWAVDEADLRRPAAVEQLRTGALDVPAASYLMVAPERLRAETERLAEIHRGLGRSVEVVDMEAVTDQLGGGEPSPQALKRFLDRQLDRSRGPDGRAGLRWVLLVGDADWFEADDHPGPSAEAADGGARGDDPEARNLVPGWTFLSRYGPAVSDHYYARDPDHPARPAFAVGRLPVVSSAELAGYVDKVAAWIASPPVAGPANLLALRDDSVGSQRRQERLLRALADVRLEVTTVAGEGGEPGEEETAGKVTREVVIEAFGRQPSLVYFGGHGSRFVWQLGDPKRPTSRAFFHLDDVALLSPVVRQPVVISVSCATAPFDHPGAGSLGEALVLGGTRGAIAFVGSAAPLETPRVFGESLVRNLLEAETVGEALMRAKVQTGRTRVSHLYGLLGDPGLPLAAQGPAGATHQQEDHH